jgi:membrane fusion protein (multidrug efflux system)
MYEGPEERNPASAAMPERTGKSGKAGARRAADEIPAEAAPRTALNTARRRTSRRARRSYLFLAIVVAVGLVGWGGYAYATRYIETTDDARIEADVVPISPRVGGQVVRVAVTDNQVVKKDELLYEIDPGPYQARLKQAEAGLSIAEANVKVAEAEVTTVTASSAGGLTVAQAGVSNAQVSVEGADAQVVAAEAALERAGAEVREVEADLDRARQLSDAGAIPAVELEHHQREADVARARFREAKAQLAVAREQTRAARTRVSETKGRLHQSEPVAAQFERSMAELDLARARVTSAEATVELARIDLDSTRVVAPASGRVTRLAGRQGQTVQPGQLLVYLVPQERYVVANFKETQVGRMKPGQEVDVEVDTYPGREFKARIESIAAGTGSRFSLLPADNVTGNFVKVVQRVPVRMVWRGKPADVLLEPGMSVIAKVHLR